MLGLNTEEPQVMFLDLNSAFATTEQQAHPSLRNRPMGVTNRLSSNCCILAASYEAKQYGIKGGMSRQEALRLCPDMVILETDPPKYHYVYKTLTGIMKDYSPNVRMKSIDEGVIDFHGTLGTVHNRSLESIGLEIKQRLRDQLGSWMKINVGIAPNQFLAKTAAGLHKPNGMDTIDHRNLLDVYSKLELTDLTGIARRYSARLKAAGIRTPLQFLEASSDTLRRYVFHSIVGDDWYQRLRGYEVDHNPTRLGMVGRQWVLAKPSLDDDYISSSFQYLCETTGKKLRYQGMDARGIQVWIRFQRGGGWQQRQMFKDTFYTDDHIYKRALELLNQRPKHLLVQTMGITCYQLTPSRRDQLSLLDEVNQQDWLTSAVDEINERYGTFKIYHANALNGTKLVKQKIPFAGTKYFELLLKQA